MRTMTSSPPSNSDPSASDPADEPASSAFDRYAVGVQRWIWRQDGWTGLREIQEHACGPILAGDRDVISSAPTAGGKTEAAFFPIFSRLAATAVEGAGCVCISPLKALINDQFERLHELGASAGVDVWRWHGDVQENHKRRFRDQPRGVLTITPESLEAQFVRRGSGIGQLFGEFEVPIQTRGEDRRKQHTRRNDACDLQDVGCFVRANRVH